MTDYTNTGITGDLDIKVFTGDLDLDLEAYDLAGSLSRNSVMQSTRAMPSMASYTNQTVNNITSR